MTKEQKIQEFLEDYDLDEKSKKVFIESVADMKIHKNHHYFMKTTDSAGSKGIIYQIYMANDEYSYQPLHVTYVEM